MNGNKKLVLEWFQKHAEHRFSPHQIVMLGNMTLSEANDHIQALVEEGILQLHTDFDYHMYSLKEE